MVAVEIVALAPGGDGGARVSECHECFFACFVWPFKTLLQINILGAVGPICFHFSQKGRGGLQENRPTVQMRLEKSGEALPKCIRTGPC